MVAPASAQVAPACTPSAPADGDSVTCSGTGTGILDDGFDDGTIVVEEGAVIIGEDQGFEFDDDVSFTNHGSITGQGDHAVQGDNKVTVVNRGTITSEDGDGVNIDDDGTVENYGVISGSDNGVQIEKNSSVINYEGGVIKGEDDHGVQGGNNARIFNYGRIIGEDSDNDDDGSDGVNIDDDGILENHGTIIADQDGVQLGENALVINHETGVIEAGKEGANINKDGSTLINHGLITAVDDGVNAARNARIVNTGTIRSTGRLNGLDQDGIDLDSGEIINTGLIFSAGIEDGIDFDPSTDASTVINGGTIEGHIGVNTDPNDTGAQTISNSGTITGRGGTALSLGAGDDTLQINGGTINGAVNMGTGTDTLVVMAMEPGVVRFYREAETVNDSNAFESDPEVIDIRIKNALYGDHILAVADPKSFGAADLLAGELSYNTSQTVLKDHQGSGFWISGAAQRGDSMKNGNLAAGYDFGSYGLFVSLASGSDEDGGDLGLRNVAVGGRGAWALGERTEARAAAFIGRGALTFGGITDGKADASFVGIATAITHRMPCGLRLSGQAGATAYSFSDFSADGLGGARFDERSVTTSYVSADLGYVMISDALSGAAITPFIGAVGIFAQGNDVTMSLGEGSTSFATGGKSSVSYLRLGVDFANEEGGAWNARLEARTNADGEYSAVLGGSMSF